MIATNSVALGAYSIANEDNTVSVGGGLSGYRRVVNLADGVNDSDAVTVRQLRNVATTANDAAAQASSNIASLRAQISTLASTPSAGLDATARAAAASAQAAADTALTTATQATGALTSLQDQITTLASAPGAGQDATARAAAASAQTTADTALAAANTAQVAADNALGRATNSLVRASSAQATADNALEVASGTASALEKVVQRVSLMDARLVDVEHKVEALDGRINNLEASVQQYKRETRAGVAAVAAMNVEVPALAAGEGALVAGVGGYKGESAIAAGVVYAASARTVLSLKVGTSRAGSAVSAGGSWKF